MESPECHGFFFKPGIRMSLNSEVTSSPESNTIFMIKAMKAHVAIAAKRRRLPKENILREEMRADAKREMLAHGFEVDEKGSTP